jgi:outer membrane protein OmpA-like peptidoglycan-associated protein
MDMNRLFFSLFLLVFCSIGALAQGSPWKMDFYLGAAGYAGDLAESPLYSRNWRPAVGLGLQYQLGIPFALKSNLYHGRLSGSDEYFTTSDWPSGDRRARFTSAFTQWNITLEYHFLESTSGALLRKFSPFITFGGGLLIYDPKPNYGFTRNPALEEAINDDIAADYGTIAANGDLGLGLDWRILDAWTIGIIASVHPTTTDYLDGLSWSGNPDKRDWFAKGGLRLQHQFQYEPDRDRDGLADAQDLCPDIAGLPEMLGCPDSDRDGVHDGDDLCPLDPGSIYLRGCPDRDGDGIADKDDLCPDVFGLIQQGGCPIEDRDGDGIEDKDDLCPNSPGPVEREGCPIVDTDQDGILDEDDRCPSVFGLSIFQGCPDRDGDGIEDSRDACPTLFGVYTHNGCPEVIFPEEAAAEINRQVLLFDSGSADLPRFRLLDQVVDFMIENQEYRLTISGYTDEEGNTQNNLQLSRARARACYRYLSQQGVDESRMKYLGLGPRDTAPGEFFAKGDALKRRVEFFLYK